MDQRKGTQRKSQLGRVSWRQADYGEKARDGKSAKDRERISVRSLERGESLLEARGPRG
jgi:hypothetical protein